MSWFFNALLAALCWGFAPFFEKAGLRSMQDPMLGVFVRSIGVVAGTLCLLPFFPRAASQLAAIPTRQLVYLLIGGLLASVVGQSFFYRALKHGEVSRAVAVGASYPIVSCLLGLLVLKEPLTAAKALGIALVLIGINLLR
ncbi:MAG: hypothetical protein A2992_01310 [Elusimicrobia bacterium RIFCSPLOWO2_01_FULL_59_12]|nr:MAG: hypothetical protein A2992_01310 [Elusimicrobia bacterium RIFCSPLOWO2_01_FULL_59_12]